jgi:hypothetical protein
MTNKGFYNAARRAKSLKEAHGENPDMGKQERQFAQVISKNKSNPENEFQVNTFKGSMEACFITLKSQ